MGRIKGIKNKTSEQKPVTPHLSPDDRIHILANIIIDRILEDQRNGQILLNKIVKK